MLKPFEKRLLIRYREHRDRPFRFLELMRSFALPLVISVGVVALSAFVMPLTITLFVSGMLLGVLLRNIALAIHATRMLPIVLRVIDWKAVNDLLDEDERSRA